MHLRLQLGGMDVKEWVELGGGKRKENLWNLGEIFTLGNGKFSHRSLWLLKTVAGGIHKGTRWGRVRTEEVAE